MKKTGCLRVDKDRMCAGTLQDNEKQCCRFKQDSAGKVTLYHCDTEDNSISSIRFTATTNTYRVVAKNPKGVIKLTKNKSSCASKCLAKLNF